MRKGFLNRFITGILFFNPIIEGLGNNMRCIGFTEGAFFEICTQIFPSSTMKKYIIPLCFLIFYFFNLSIQAQNIPVKGRITNSFTNQALAQITVSVQGTRISSPSDSNGNYLLLIPTEGVYTLEFQALGFKTRILPEIQIYQNKPNIFDISLEENKTVLKGVQVVAGLKSKTVESPLSLRIIGIAEIKRNPGGNRDISKALQSLPGVATTTGFRNDIIVRGGAPNENRFYLDGVEIPNINHFATQGSSGGPVGLLNVDFIREVNFYSGAFPANKGNALSSVLDFRQKDGRNDKQTGALTLGSSDLALTAEGPLWKNATYLASIRRSYLQFLFKLLNLSFLPTYNDAQFKIKWKIDSKNELSFLGLGALDRFTLNTAANTTEAQQFQLATIPVNSQNNYTLGAVYKHFGKKGYTTLVLSRDYLENISTKYQNNDPNSILIQDYHSKEIENKLRLEESDQLGSITLNYGFNLESGTSITHNYNLAPSGNFNYNSSLDLVKYGAFTQFSKSILEDKLGLSLGLRIDGNSFLNQDKNPLKQFSPRISLSYDLGSGLGLNFNTGLYYQLPAYTLLSFRDNTGNLTNQNAEYISNWESVIGLDFINPSNIKFSAEAFYKLYQHYPFIQNYGDTISLANFGSDFGIVGDRRLVGLGNGRAYGIEFLVQRRVKKGFYGIATLTLVRSEFQDKSGVYIPSSWDSKVFMSFTGGRVFKKGWELGAKLRMSGGTPYTPYNISQSSLITNYSINPMGIPDYNQLNSSRLGFFYQLDGRIDKKINWKKISLDFYFDIQNLTNNVYSLAPYLVLDKDSQGNTQTLPGDPSRYKTKLLNNTTGNVLPSLGIILELNR